MRIVVNKKEFAELVVQCRNCKRFDECNNCVFNNFNCNGRGIEEFCDISEIAPIPTESPFFYKDFFYKNSPDYEPTCEEHYE